MGIKQILKDAISGKKTEEQIAREKRREPLSYFEEMYYKYVDFLRDNHDDLTQTDQWDRVFDVLDKLRIHPGYTLDDYRSKASNDNTLMLYARPANIPRPSDKEFVKWECANNPFSLFHGTINIKGKYGIQEPLFGHMAENDEENKVEVDPFFPAAITPEDVVYLENDEKSIWQALLLHMTYRFIGMRWHGGYSRREFVFCREDLPKIREKSLEKYGPIPEIDEMLFMPQIVKPGNTCNSRNGHIKFCWWNRWGGLERMTIPYRHSSLFNTVKFGDLSCETLYYYKCGIRF